MSGKSRNPNPKIQVPEEGFYLSHNGPPKVTGPTMNAAGQTPSNGKVSASPPPPPKK